MKRGDEKGLMMSVIVFVKVVTYPWQVEKKGKKKGGCEVKSQGGNMASRPLPVLCWSEQIEFISHCLIFCHNNAVEPSVRVLYYSGKL